MVNHPMLHLDLDRKIVAGRFDQFSNLVELAQLIQHSKGSRIADQFLLDGIGLRLNENLNESYHREAFDYHLGLLLAHLGQPERAVDHLARSGVLPSSGGDMLFESQVAESLLLHQHQSKAAARGVPSILLASMPRAGSVSLTQSIAAALDAPVIRISTGDFPNYVLVPTWLNAFSPGGAVAHDHFGASPFNLQILKNAGWREVFVLVRDPRASAASLLQRGRSAANRCNAAEDVEHRIVESALNSYIPWLHEWIAAQAMPELRLHWIKYGETVGDIIGTVQRVFEVFRANYPALDTLLSKPVREVTGNFVQGDDDAWRSLVGAEGRNRLWNAISPQAAELLGLQP